MPQRRLSGGLHGRARDNLGQDRSDPEGQNEAIVNSHPDDATSNHALECDMDQFVDSVEEQQDEGSSSDDGNSDDHGQRLADGQLVAVDGHGYRVVVEPDDDGESAGQDDDDDDEDEFETEVEEEDEDEEQDEEEEEEREDQLATRARVLRMLIGGSHSAARRRIPEGTVRLPLPIQPLQGNLAARTNADTRAQDVGQANDIWASLDSGFDSSRAPTIRTSTHRKQQQDQLRKKLPSVQQDQPHDCSIANGQASKRHCTPNRSSPGRVQQQQQAVDESPGPSRRSLAGLFHSATSIMTRGASRRSAAADPAGDGSGPPAVEADPGADDNPGSSSRSRDGPTGFRLVNTTQMLFKREVSLGRQLGFSRTQQRHLMCHRNLPLHPQQIRDSMQSRAYIGQYSASGDFFIAAYQDRRVRLYDTQNNWRLRKDVTTRMTRWTITDTTLSPDQRLLVYASISPVAFVVNVGSSYDVVESRANITELHEPLAFDGSNAAGAAGNRPRRGRLSLGGLDASDDEDDFGYQGRDFGIWSIAWSPQGGQLIAGTNDESVYVYDIESKRCLMRLAGHKDDVNAVAYLHGDTNSGNGSSGSDPNVIVSGSDDHMVRVWDLRDRSGRVGVPNGVLVGHTEGVTHICPKGDGYHLISNSKDQTIKLWDIRAALSPAAAAAAASRRPAIPRWDYRWEEYPAAGYAVTHPDDVSLMTYRGHSVLQTLIRAYFSPMHTTGQRYIYAGSSDGVINAWDVVSGKLVVHFEYHRALVRDCSWHPYESELTTVSWDGSIVNWGPGLPQRDKEKQLQQARYGDVGRYY